MIWDTVLGIGKQILKIVDDAVPDADLKQKLQQEIQKTLLSNSQELLRLQAQIITTEAKSESWLTRNWRPIVMLTFATLMVADWLGFTAPNLTPELKMKLFDIIQLGLGGYVIGRSAEKTLPKVARILASSRRTSKKSSAGADDWLEEDM